MALLLLSCVAGVLTVLAPCVLPLLPIIIGGAVQDARRRWKPYVITASLAVSIVLFTLLLKVSVVFLSVPPQSWQIISGIILLAIGIAMTFPALWEKIAARGGRITRWANVVLARGHQRNNIAGDVMIGAALGPVFSSCSPTYFVILATVLPQNFFLGIVHLFAYALGLALVLLLVALAGRRLLSTLGVIADPHGRFKRAMGVLFLIVGIAVVSGWDKKLETQLITSGAFDWLTNVEYRFLKNVE